MAAITTLPNHYTTEFRSNWEHKAQQMENRLRDYVTVERFTGERMRFNLIDENGDVHEVTERAGATEHDDLGTEVRWIYCKLWDKAHLIDKHDNLLLGEVSAPDSSVLQSMFAAFARNNELQIINALRDAAYTGKAGTSSTAFDTSNQQIAVDYVDPGGSAANKNLTIAKLRKVRSILGINEVAGQSMTGMNEPIVMAVSQQQLDGLLTTTEVTSGDYNTIKALVQGEVDTFMGIKFVRTQQLYYSSTNIRECLAWVRSGVKFSQSVNDVRIDPRPDRKYAHQIYVDCYNGGVRTEEKKAIKILCDETAAAA